MVCPVKTWMPLETGRSFDLENRESDAIFPQDSWKPSILEEHLPDGDPGITPPIEKWRVYLVMRPVAVTIIGLPQRVRFPEHSPCHLLADPDECRICIVPGMRKINRQYL